MRMHVWVCYQKGAAQQELPPWPRAQHAARGCEPGCEPCSGCMSFPDGPTSMLWHSMAAPSLCNGMRLPNCCHCGHHARLSLAARRAGQRRRSACVSQHVPAALPGNAYTWKAGVLRRQHWPVSLASQGADTTHLGSNLRHSKGRRGREAGQELGTAGRAHMPDSLQPCSIPAVTGNAGAHSSPYSLV